MARAEQRDQVPMFSSTTDCMRCWDPAQAGISEQDNSIVSEINVVKFKDRTI